MRVMIASLFAEDGEVYTVNAKGMTRLVKFSCVYGNYSRFIQWMLNKLKLYKSQPIRILISPNQVQEFWNQYHAREERLQFLNYGSLENSVGG
jgi:hypothetical protein